jgi:hypothetical protein
MCSCCETADGNASSVKLPKPPLTAETESEVETIRHPRGHDRSANAARLGIRGVRIGFKREVGVSRVAALSGTSPHSLGEGVVHAGDVFERNAGHPFCDLDGVEEPDAGH